jgi:UDP-N-acetylglucosamine 3-dehydrogenase
MVLRLGLVGRGRWGRNIERTLLTFPDVSVAVIAKGERPPTGLDGVLIATQSATHAETALPYIEAGIATFIEKPMTTALADAERIRDAAGRSGAIVFVGHILLYHPAFLAALDLLPSLGAIRYLLCEGMNGSPRADSSVLWDWLPHDLSIARAIFGRDPDSAAAWSLSGGETLAAALTKFQFGDVPVVSTVSWLSPVRRRRVTMGCESATLVFDDGAERRLALHGMHGELTYPAYSDALPLTQEMAAFLRAVRSGKADAAHIQTGISVVAAIAAAERSLALGGQSVVIR